MIKYRLKCSADHAFDSWFASANAFDKLRAAGHLSCTICGDTDVTKAIMAPQVRAAKVTDLAKPDTDAERALQDLRRKVEENSEYVGTSFATEARAIHDGDAPERAIYGEAKPAEAMKLVKEGVPIAPLPFIPERKTN
ncbi:DUF1178 family protein [Actibacterium sp. 188UL27-1]|uniref:DUF1178 family protein n=1 Tax=Actibacterium sp. 188UL27-1 TaxID=2786961 RepID=UPI00195E7898|nr:DUF1178 family protein [Actibacterium sp. 188UL27-1]MBM7066904.1 DUF1178 family protein [Actibacterium sp. 188UL27-1]